MPTQTLAFQALRTRKWQDQSGNDRYTTEVVVGVRGQIVMIDGPKAAEIRKVRQDG